VHRPAKWLTVGALLAVCGLAPATPLGATTTFRLPSPGLPKTVAALVAKSGSITTIPADLDPAVHLLTQDNMANTDLHASDAGCLGIKASCTYGDKRSKKLVVLLGDSHAWMWLAAVNPLMNAQGYKLQLVWNPGCPFAELPDYSNATCASWRGPVLTTILRERPALVLLSERTSADLDASHALYSTSQWTAAIEATLGVFKSAGVKVAVIGDIPIFGDHEVAACLSRYPQDVQECATPINSPSPDVAQHSATERAAATAEGDRFIDPIPWICGTTTCSPIVGSYATYFDWAHLSATYSAFLATDMADAVKPLL
jgi:hypothetical protein